MNLRPLSELTPQPVEWFWPGYLAAGSLAILDGDPGQGKSLVTLDLAARVTTGRSWPAADPAAAPAPRNPANVLLLCSEDVDSAIHARLRAAGADLDRVFLWPKNGDHALPLFPADIARLDVAMTQTQAQFVVIDPIMSFLDRSVMSASDVSVRRALSPLARLADRHGCVILLVRHLNKSTSGPALYRGGGSIGFIAACRLAWLAAPDPRHDDRFILAQTKNNHAPRQPSLAYAITTPSGADLPRIDWLGPTPWTADELSARRPRPSRRRARDFLRRFLAAGPKTSAEIWTAATHLGLRRNTLYRAKADLDVQATRIQAGQSRLASWRLPEHSQTVPSETPELDAWLNRWHELHEPNNPLDDEPQRPAR